MYSFFFFQAEDGIRDGHVTGVQTCALPISKQGNNFSYGRYDKCCDRSRCNNYNCLCTNYSRLYGNFTNYKCPNNTNRLPNCSWHSHSSFPNNLKYNQEHKRFKNKRKWYAFSCFLKN